METTRTLRLAVLLIACVALLGAQGLTTTATKDDWEEINFEFNSSILSDGYPSLLRLADLLHSHPGYTVALSGNTDSVGSEQYNQKLGQARAETVMAFLVKYGASRNQILIASYGKRRPKVSNATREGRFMNRRVYMEVKDAQGNVVSAGGVGEAIKAIQGAQPVTSRDCCDEVLKRLDKLDDILAALKNLKDENDRLKQDVAGLKEAQAGLEKQVAGLPRPPDKAEMQKMMDTTADNAIEKAKPPRFSLLGLNVGPSLTDVKTGITPAGTPIARADSGSITMSGKGRYFAPFGRDQSAALQAEAEILYYRDRQEGQFDIGLVNRWNRVQAGLFSSIKHVNITNLGGGTLGQAAFTADILFPRGRIGLFGTKGYLDNRVIARVPTPLDPGVSNAVSYNLLTEYYLKLVDQIGGSAQVGLWNDAYVEGNFGALFRSGGNNRPGGTVRLVQPITSRLSATVEASLNEGMVGSTNTGRIAVGLQLGNWVRPKDFMSVKHPVPVDIPRVRYEVLTRQVRVSASVPVADAGVDQLNVAAGTITLNGSASYSPDGLPLTYQWTQISGPAVTLASATSATTTFTAAAGQSYAFRLTVTDSQGGQGSAKTTVTTRSGATPTVVRFVATPAVISPGQTTTLAWEVQGADTVEISGVGPVDPQAGTATLSPAQTTTYTLTATNAQGSVNQVVTVTVGTSGAPAVVFYAYPPVIRSGEKAALVWQTSNATSVSISGVGTVDLNGNYLVAPTQTTVYVLTATSAGGGQMTASVTVTVNPPATTIASFSANPSTISAGQTATLSWTTVDAAWAYIDGIGYVVANGSIQVSPTTTTTYTLRAGGNGPVEPQTVTVTVNP